MGVVTLLPNGQQQFFNNDGTPLAGGFVYHYVPGTTTPSTTYVDQGLTTPNVDPIILDSAGRATIWGNTTYRQIVTDDVGNTIWDQLTGIGPLDNLVLTNPTITGGTITGATISGGTITASIGTSEVTAAGPNPNLIPLNPVQGTRTVAQFVGSFVDARNFLGASNAALRATSDDSSVIQAAINYAQSIGGATVYLGPGPLNIPAGSSINWPFNAIGISLKGDGPLVTMIAINGNLTGDVFAITGGNSRFCKIYDLGFNCIGVASGGSLINFTNVLDAKVEDVFMGGGINVGIIINGGAQQFTAFIENVHYAAAGSSLAFVVAGADPAGNVSDITVNSCHISGGQYGVFLQQCNGVHISDLEIFNAGIYGIGMLPAVGQNLGFVQIANVDLQGCGQGVFVGTNGGSSHFVSIAGSIAVGCTTGFGIDSVSGITGNVSITGCHAFGNNNSGIAVHNANEVAISGCTLNGNSLSTPGLYSGVDIQNAQNCTIIGNIITRSIAGQQAYGVNLGGTSDYCTVIGNSTLGGGTGSIGNGASGTHNVVVNNTGT